MSINSRDENSFNNYVFGGSFLLESSIEWIQSNLNPEDVFSKENLEIWAEENGFVEEDS